MTEDSQLGSQSPSSIAVQLRRVGLLVFVFGLLMAAVLGYFEITHPVESPTDALTDGYYKSQSAQMQKMVGDIGPVSLTLRKDLERAVPAIGLGFFTTVFAFFCFVRAGRLDRPNA